jgi:hypothetical protein
MTTATPATQQRRPRPPRSARRVGHVSAAVVNLVLLWLLNVAPGWEWLPFLTPDFAGLVGLINTSLVVGVAIDLAYVIDDPPWAKSLGDAVTAAFACAILVRTWAIFPFDLGSWSGWEPALRVLVGLLAIATAIGVVASLAQFVRALVERRDPGSDD